MEGSSYVCCGIVRRVWSISCKTAVAYWTRTRTQTHTRLGEGRVDNAPQPTHAHTQAQTDSHTHAHTHIYLVEGQMDDVLQREDANDRLHIVVTPGSTQGQPVSQSGVGDGRWAVQGYGIPR